MNAELDHWKKFYNSHSNDERLRTPSSFCLFVLDYFKNQNQLHILEAGCGTGRDAIHLEKTHIVTGVDLEKKKKNSDNFTFENADFCAYTKKDFDVIYSRFTYHSITDEQQDIFLNSIQKPGTFLCMEFRSDKGQDDNLHYGKDHFRNFVNLEKFKARISLDFDILLLKESKGFAVYGDEDPVCIRAILRKK